MNIQNLSLNPFVSISRPNFKGQDTNAVTKPYPNDTFIKSKPNLKKGQILSEDGTIFTRPVTSMFRTDVSWCNFAKYVNRRFKDYDKVNTCVYACSDGSEAYTLSMLFQEMADEPEKFFPIIAKDIDGNAIKKNIENQKGKRLTKGPDYITSRYSLNLNDSEISKYIDVDFDENDREVTYLTEKTVAPVEFYEANILEDLESIDPNTPTIVTCLNMWPYVDPKEYEEFANKLYERLAVGSIVVVGEYDYKGESGRENSDKFPKALLNSGFSVADSNTNKCFNLVFEKN